jgi:hypothetical protein
MAAEKLTLVFENLSPRESTEMVNGATLRTIFELAGAGAPSEDMLAKLKSKDAIVPITIEGSHNLLDRIAHTAAQYYSPAVVRGDFSAESLQTNCSAGTLAKMAAWVQCKS